MASEEMWEKISCSMKELNLALTLACGQSFRWRELTQGHWTGVLGGHIWTLKQSDESLYYRVHASRHTVAGSEEECKKQVELSSLKHQLTQQVKDSGYFRAILRDYFQLDINLSELYSHWSKVDTNFRDKALDYAGVRIMRQDPVENLFSFICSSNNNISRISLMVEKMCERFGDFIAEVDGISYYAFPAVDKLADCSAEKTLRDLGFGYRAKYIIQSAGYIMKNHSAQWLYELRYVSYDEAKYQLMKLPGVGEKVADCVCLMSLDKNQAVPVDTHVWQIVIRDYQPEHLNKTKHITSTVYKQIGDFFRDLWGSHAGWAHSVLFSADLKKFKAKNLKTPKRSNVCEEEKGKKMKKKQS